MCGKTARTVRRTGRAKALPDPYWPAKVIDGVGLGALEAAVLEAARHEGVEQDDVVPGRGQRGEQVLAIVTGRLRDEPDGRRTRAPSGARHSPPGPQ